MLINVNGAFPIHNITVKIFNVCTKCAGRPGILQERMPDCHLDGWTLISLHVLGATAKIHMLASMYSPRNQACQGNFPPVADMQPVEWYTN